MSAANWAMANSSTAVFPKQFYFPEGNFSCYKPYCPAPNNKEVQSWCPEEDPSSSGARLEEGKVHPQISAPFILLIVLALLAVLVAPLVFRLRRVRATTIFPPANPPNNLSNSFKTVPSPASIPEVVAQKTWNAFHQFASSCISDLPEVVDPELVNAPGPDGSHPLMVAAQKGSAARIQQLVDLGAKVNARNDRTGETGLHVAARYSNVAAIRALLRLKADPNIQENGGRTPLHEAISAKSESGVSELLSCPRTNLNFQDKNGFTPLIQAIRMGCDPITMEITGSSKVNYGIKDKKGRTVVHHAVMTKSHNLLGILAGLSNCLHVKDEDGLTPLHLAIKENDPKACLILMDHGSFEDEVQESAFDYACSLGCIDLCTLMINHLNENGNSSWKPSRQGKRSKIGSKSHCTKKIKTGVTQNRNGLLDATTSQSNLQQQQRTNRASLSILSESLESCYHSQSSSVHSTTDPLLNMSLITPGNVKRESSGYYSATSPDNPFLSSSTQKIPSPSNYDDFVYCLLSDDVAEDAAADSNNPRDALQCPTNGTMASPNLSPCQFSNVVTTGLLEKGNLEYPSNSNIQSNQNSAPVKWQTNDGMECPGNSTMPVYQHPPVVRQQVDYAIECPSSTIAQNPHISTIANAFTDGSQTSTMATYQNCPLVRNQSDYIIECTNTNAANPYSTISSIGNQETNSVPMPAYQIPTLVPQQQFPDRMEGPNNQNSGTWGSHNYTSTSIYQFPFIFTQQVPSRGEIRNHTNTRHYQSPPADLMHQASCTMENLNPLNRSFSNVVLHQTTGMMETSNTATASPPLLLELLPSMAEAPTNASAMFYDPHMSQNPTFPRHQTTYDMMPQPYHQWSYSANGPTSTTSNMNQCHLNLVTNDEVAYNASTHLDCNFSEHVV